MHEISFQPNAIDVAECFKEGWKTFKSRFWLFLGVCLFLGIAVGFLVQSISPFPTVVTRLVSTVLSGCFSTGIFYLYLSEIDGKRTDFMMISQVLPSALSIGAISILASAPSLIIGGISAGAFTGDSSFPSSNFSAAIGLQISLLMLAGVVISFFLYFAYPLIAEYRLGGYETVKLSASAAMQNIKGIFALAILNFLLMAGAIAIGVLLIIGIGSGATAFGFANSILVVIPLWLLIAAASSFSYSTVSHAYRFVFPKSEGSVI